MQAARNTRSLNARAFLQEGVCAIKGHGKEIDPMIKEAIGWLVEKVGARYELLHKEIETAVEALKERQSRERLDRQHRLAHLSYVCNFAVGAI